MSESAAAHSVEPKSLSMPDRLLALVGACLAIFVFPLFPLGLEKTLTSQISSANAASCLVTFAAAYAVITKVKVTSYFCWAVAVAAAGCFTPQLFRNDVEVGSVILFGFCIVIGLGVFERFEMHVVSGKPMEF